MARMDISEELEELLDIHGLQELLEINDILEIDLIIGLWEQGLIRTREDLDNE